MRQIFGGRAGDKIGWRENSWLMSDIAIYSKCLRARCSFVFNEMAEVNATIG